MKEKKKSIVFLGSSGFPYVKEATITRILYLGQALKEAGFDVLIVNRKGRYVDFGENIKLAAQGHLGGIEFVYTSGDPHYSQDFFKRNTTKIKGFINEIALLVHLKRHGKLHYAFVYTHFFNTLIIYRLLSKIIGFKIVINIVEYLSMIEAKKSPLMRLNDWAFDNYLSYFGDGFIPISDFLITKLKGRNKDKYLKIPPIFDYSIFEGPKTNTHPNQYFLFCGGAGFYQVIKLIVDSYQRLNHPEFRLYIVSNGAPHYVKRVQDLIADDPTIKLFQNLSNQELYDLYQNAYALLIPLRNTIQDTARFPNKISEYLATRNPVITTNFGEIPKYFKDNENAFIADEFSIESYSKAMMRSIENPDLCRKIGENGYETGKMYFSFSNYVTPLKDLLNKL